MKSQHSSEERPARSCIKISCIDAENAAVNVKYEEGAEKEQEKKKMEVGDSPPPLRHKAAKTTAHRGQYRLPPFFQYQ